MSIFQVLETTCTTDVSSCCSDYGIAMYLYIIKQALLIIQIVVPIILLVMATVQLIRMMITPDDKKHPKTLLNKFIAAVLVFFTPFIINLVLSILPDGFELSACWESAEGIAKTMQSSTHYNIEKTDNRKKIVNAEEYKPIKASDVAEGKGLTVDSSSTAGQKIVNYAKQFVGNPYVWGGNSLTNGCDCSHFVYLVLKNLDVYSGSYVTSSNWANLGEKVKGGIKNAQAGDVVVYNGHVGFYDGTGNLVEAQGKKYGITDNRKAEHGKKIIAVRRFV